MSNIAASHSKRKREPLTAKESKQDKFVRKAGEVFEGKENTSDVVVCAVTFFNFFKPLKDREVELAKEGKTHNCPLAKRVHHIDGHYTKKLLPWLEKITVKEASEPIENNDKFIKLLNIYANCLKKDKRETFKKAFEIHLKDGLEGEAKKLDNLYRRFQLFGSRGYDLSDHTRQDLLQNHLAFYFYEAAEECFEPESQWSHLHLKGIYQFLSELQIGDERPFSEDKEAVYAAYSAHKDYKFELEKLGSCEDEDTDNTQAKQKLQQLAGCYIKALEALGEAVNIKLSHLADKGIDEEIEQAARAYMRKEDFKFWGSTLLLFLFSLATIISTVVILLSQSNE